MMGKSLDWRRIESELEDIARSNGYALDVNEAHDKIILLEGEVDSPVNLTELAKELAERLK